METKKPYATMNEVAKLYRYDSSRIRQICIAHGIGNLIEGRIRLLTARDVKKIGSFLRRNGNSRES